jgi:hypothetical protein
MEENEKLVTLLKKEIEDTEKELNKMRTELKTIFEKRTNLTKELRKKTKAKYLLSGEKPPKKKKKERTSQLIQTNEENKVD